MAYGAPNAYDPTNVMGRRFAAALIDAIPWIIIGFFIVGHSLTRVDNVSSSFCDVFKSTHGSSQICIQPSGSSTAYYGSDFRTSTLLFSLLYWFVIAGLLQGATGATFGKHMVGLRVVDGSGSVCGMGKAILRTVIGYFEIFFCFLIGGITALATRPHRRIGDFAAGTYVVAKEDVGRAIGSPPSAGAYPPPWNPPGGGWGPPTGGQPWGAPTPAPGWGAPNPTPTPSWGPPPAQDAPTTTPPAAEPPRTWGAPAPSEPATQPQPQAEPRPEPHAESTPAADAPGWAAPTPAAEPEQAPPPQAQPEPQTAAAPASGQREPQWDPQRNAWVYWEAETGRWLQHDPATDAWGPLS